MRNALFLAAVFCLIGAGVAEASDRWGSKAELRSKGYVAIGGNVVVIPERLQSGDRIEFFDDYGKSIMSHLVGNGFLRIDFTSILSGVYDMVIYRNKEIIAEEMVPVIGMVEELGQVAEQGK
jgi:hypothetical protein